MAESPSTWPPRFEELWRVLQQPLKLPPAPSPSVEEPPSAEPIPLEEPMALSLRTLLGEGSLRMERELLLRYGGGQSYEGFVRRAAATPEALPRAIVFPDSEQMLASLIVWAEERGFALLPWGSGLHPYRGKRIEKPFLVVDMDRMDRIYPVDRMRGEVRVQGGSRWIEVERRLNEIGLTLGYQHPVVNLSIGGRIASNDCNLFDLRYSSLHEALRTLRMVTPRGPIHLGNPEDARHSLWSLAVGQQGRWGMITEVGLRLYPQAPEGLLIKAEFGSWSEAIGAARQLVEDRLPLLFVMAWPSSLDSIMRPGEERPPLARLRRKLGGGRNGQGIALWAALEGRPECMTMTRKIVAEVLQDNKGNMLFTEKVAGGEHPFDDLCFVSVGHCRLCAQEMWKRGILATTISHPAAWDNAAEALADWEESVASVLQASGGTEAMIASIFFAQRSDVRFRSLLIARQAEGGPAAWQRQLEMLASVSEAAVRRWQPGSYTTALDARLVKALTEALDPAGVMAR